MNKEYIKAKLSNIPHAPGSYQMKDKNGEIIYVGKAKDLHNRVNQYFVGAHDFKTTKMVSHIEDFDFIVTKNEQESLILEINLIKKYRPKYNIQFMDDSTYPYIKLTNEDYPRLTIARDMKKDKKARYFGPFPDVTAARNTMKLLQSIYPFRRCVHMPSKLCLYYHMGQCLGPCVYDIDPAKYKEMAAQVTRFMNGDTGDIVHQLQEKMMAASEQLEFEKAAVYKNMIESVTTVTKDQQLIEQDSRGNLDVFAWYLDKGYLAIAGFLVRRGTVLSKEFRLRPLYGDAKEEFISFVMQYYQDHPASSELVIPNEIEEDTVQQMSSILNVKVTQPQKGYRKRLIEMCIDNAKKQLELKFQTVEKQDSETEMAVEQLSRLANHEMNRVELFDNSHTAGQFTVAACVVYEDGVPDRKDYRLYRLHTANSDVDSMKEVVYRRYFRLVNENGRLPDGILVDGGWTQIEAAKEILDALGISDKIKLMGLVKDDHHNTNALMDTNGETFDIPKDSSLFFLLTRMQDEVHRVAITYHRKLRAKAQTKSILDEIEGIGPKRKRLLLKTFGNFTNLKAAPEEEIAKVVPKETAHLVYEALHTNENATVDQRVDSQ
ncbi:MAG: excinuclease ABC subunit UvrC [Lactimicrobium massiliense]|nr:excinuclease ABC subunit UvrC [Lactimicrobium massiliense]MDD6674823.1 excinuclease ABC subunit UvrC [Lactimicrobium massiliense]